MLIAVASVVVVALGGAAVALKFSFNKRNEARGDSSQVRSVNVRGTGHTTAGGDITFNPPGASGSGHQNETD